MILRYVSIFLLLFVPWPAAFASDSLKIVTFNVPPFIYFNQSTNKVEGTLTDEVRKRAKGCDIAVNFIVTPSWARAYQAALEGTADGVIPTNYTEERTLAFDYARPSIGEVNASLIVRKDSPHYHFTGFDMLDNQRVVKRSKGLLGKSYEAYEKLGKMTVIERLTSKGLAEELFSGHVDFIIANYSAIVFHLGEEQMSTRARVLSPTVGKSVQYLALSKNRAPAYAQGTPASDCILGASQ